MIREMSERGMSVSEIARRMGISRPTVRKYIKADRPVRYSREGRVSIVSPYEDYIREMINRYNLSAVRIYESIREKGYPGSYTTVKKVCRRYRTDRSIKAVYRYETEPGKQAQVDFGEFGRIVMDGKWMKLYCFSMILGYSRMRYVEFTVDISTENVIRMHRNAFMYFGGYTNTILYDNMKQVVLERKLRAGESTFNRKFKDFMDYYGIVIRLCYPYRPQTKGKIENTIKFIRGNFWNGRTFSSIDDINAEAYSWLTAVNNRTHGTTGRIPAEMSKEEELSACDDYYPITINSVRKVSRDCYVSYRGNRYSVPWRYAGRAATVVEDTLIRIEIDGYVVAEHDILHGTGRISRKKEHFEGLLKAIREENVTRFSQQVEKRDLRNYEVI